MNNPSLPPAPAPAHKKEPAWQSIANAPHAESYIIHEDIAESLDALANMFGEHTPGWRAGVINLPGFSSALWQTPEKRHELEQMLVTLLHGKHNYLTCLLHTPQVIFVGKLEGMVQIETVCPRLAAYLNPGKANEFHYYDLGHHNTEFARLCQKWAVDARLQQKLEKEVENELSPEQKITFTITGVQKQMRKNRFLMHILVVEDDPSTALLLAQLMNQQYVVATAYDAVQAVQEYRKTVPDMVLLDIGLPDVNGLDLLQKIMTADPEAFVVMLTANAFKANLENALARGARGFMAKPFNREKLNSYIQAALHLKRQGEK